MRSDPGLAYAFGASIAIMVLLAVIFLVLESLGINS
jgi:hypothetical protein